MNVRHRAWGVALLGMITAAGCARRESGPLTASGALEATEVIVSSRGAGTAQKLMAAEGDSVGRNAVLALVDVQKLEMQRGGLQDRKSVV